ncbi:MAG: hypothetical protein IH586_13095, partial [Anaerolineaceae bacterium]|nr:hypothetical protein [Anaerolineaceae bacterium]
QYYRAASHLTDPPDRQPDNAVQLVAGKPAWVRVYVRSGFFKGNITNVTGTLEVSKRKGGFIFIPSLTLSPQPPGSVTARTNPDYATERGSIGYTLNFIIPASEMCGSMRLRATITSPAGDTDENVIHIAAKLRQTLRLRGIMVGYNGPTSTAPGAPNLTLAAPTVANLQTTSAWTLLTFPVRSVANYSSGGTITWTLPLTDPPSCSGCCTPNWVALNTAVQAQRVADGNRTDVLYYGLMAAGIPMGPIIGCNTGGVSTGSNNDGVTMAHELGHHCGLPHAPCGTPGDPNYPAYEPYDPPATPMASTGEYGLDISTGNVFSPATFKDMMAYCGPRWISLYNYGRLTNNANLDPVSVCQDYHWWRDVILYDPIIFPEKWLPDPPPEPGWRVRDVQRSPVISIIGVIHSEKEIQITSVMRLEAVPQVVNGNETQYTAEIIGEKGTVAAHSVVYRLQPHSAGCGCEGEDSGQESRYPFVFQAFLPDSQRGEALRIRRGEEGLWERKAPKRAPRISSFKASAQENRLVAEWNFEGSSGEEAEFWLQWSADKGQTWNALTSGLHGEHAEVDLSGGPTGKALVRVLGSDGFSTAASKPVSVGFPESGAAVSILSPRNGQTFLAGSAMRLWGAAAGADGEPLEVRETRWLLDGEVVAEGLDVFIAAPRPGQHKLTLQVTWANTTGEDTLVFVTVEGE